MFISFLKRLYIIPPIKSAITSPFGSAISFSRNTASEPNAKQESDLVISQSCIDRLKKIAPEGSFLRITIDGGGCSGFQYRFDLDSTLQSDDVCFNRDGARVVVDKISLDFLRGSTIEYKEELIRASFGIVNNPQAESKCSCGTSFAVKIS